MTVGVGRKASRKGRLDLGPQFHFITLLTLTLATQNRRILPDNPNNNSDLR